MTAAPAADGDFNGARLGDWLAHWARVTPAAEAVVSREGRLSWSGLEAAVRACARAMMAAGVERGDRVAVLAPPGPEFLTTFLAAAAIGSIWVGLNPRYAEAELNATVARLRPRLVLASPAIEGRSYLGWLAALPDTTAAVSLDEAPAGSRTGSHAAFLAGGEAVAPDRLAERCEGTRAEDPCLIVFTSGSTGTPKGAMISQAALVGTSRVQLSVWPAAPLRVLNNLPINHIGCVGDLSCYALVGGGTLVFSPRFDPAQSLALIEAEGVTVWGQVPTMFQLTLDAPGFEAARLRSLQLVFWGGAPASSHLVERLQAICPRVATSYGQTETVGSVAFTPPGASAGLLAASVGRAVPPYAIRIAAPAGEGGEVEVRTPFGMLGYWEDPAASAAAVSVDGWRRTGDVGVLSPDGDLALRGRVHDIFKSGGYNIYPPEIEAALESHPRILQAAVIGAPDPLYGMAALAFVVADGAAPSADDLRLHLRARLANYKVPKRFVVVEALPRLPVGKIDKQALLEWANRP